MEIAPDEQIHLNQLTQKSTLFIRGWNEEELKFKFISPLIEKVTLEEKGSFESKALEGFVLDIETLFK